MQKSSICGAIHTCLPFLWKSLWLPKRDIEIWAGLNVHLNTGGGSIQGSSIKIEQGCSISLCCKEAPQGRIMTVGCVQTVHTNDGIKSNSKVISKLKPVSRGIIDFKKPLSLICAFQQVGRENGSDHTISTDIQMFAKCHLWCHKNIRSSTRHSLEWQQRS